MSDEKLEDLQQKANSGDIESATALGIKYLEGDGVDVSYTLADKYLKKAAIEGNAVAQYRYAIMLALGLTGKKSDPRRAVTWLLKSAIQNYSPALREYGLCFSNGFGVPCNYMQAFVFLNKAIEAGDFEAMVDLSDLYASGVVTIDDCESNIVKLCQTAADNNIASASNKLGSWYYNGDYGLEKDLNKAAECFKKAGELGLKNALFNLAMTYKEQNSTEQMIATLEECVKNKFMPAYEELSNLYLEGKVVPKDKKKAKELLQELIDLINDEKPVLNVKQMIQGFIMFTEDGKKRTMIGHLRQAIAKIDSELKND